MPLTQQIANTLYDGSFTIVGGDIGSVHVGQEVVAVRPLPTAPIRGYVNLIWSASFLITPGSLNPVPGYWNELEGAAEPSLGWYEIRYDATVMERYPIKTFSLGTPKVTGVWDGVTTNRPGDTYVVGNGATLVSVNIGSDRPFRGNLIRYYIRPGLNGTLYLAVNTGFTDNLSDTNKYIIHP